MKIYKALNTVYLHKRAFNMDTIICELDNGMILCVDSFTCSCKEKQFVKVWLPTENRWVGTYANNQYIYAMRKYYREHGRKRNDGKYVNYASMMKHARKKKKSGGGGSRDYVNAITDYECTKNPLHDFRRCYN